MQGLHLTADLGGCREDLPALTDPDALRSLCLAAVAAARLNAVGDRFHGFAPENGEPRGVTGVVLLAESHVAVHTWPELGAVTLDVYVCNRGEDNSARAQALLEALVQAFMPRSTLRHSLQRGMLGARAHSSVEPDPRSH
ncbi:MAG TPA: adenosylmethionine decarboxylase [Burkholderiaceae bacterium]|jgi:S-adenosylmethionine decarboxylase proenzyme|nr:adenosylmethionine decarboxylase [Burkholderiaceae bacterium]